MLDFDLSPNSTFSIEEDDSYLTKFGTPLQFKKLMEKPAAISPTFHINIKDDFSYIDTSPLSVKQAVQFKLNNSLLNEQNKINNSSSIPSSSRIRRPLINDFDSLKLSPVHYGNRKQRLKPSSSKYFIESTPNQKENYNINRVFNKSIRTKSRQENFITPEKRQVTFDTSPSTNFIWSLKKKKDDAEKIQKEKLELEKSINETGAVRYAKNQQVCKSIQEKLEQFVRENQEIDSEEKIVDVKVETIKSPKSVEKPKDSPDLHLAFLARKQRDAEFHKKREAIVDESTSGSMLAHSDITKQLEEKLRDFYKQNESNTPQLNKLKPVSEISTTPRVVSNRNNSKSINSANGKTKRIPPPTKIGFVTPMSAPRGRKQTGEDRPSVNRWR